MIVDYRILLKNGGILMNFNALVIIFWILDILNLGFMEMFDTTYPLNTLFWVLYFLLVPSLVARY